MTVALTSPITTVRTATQGPEYKTGDRTEFKSGLFVYGYNGAGAVHVKGAPAWGMSVTVPYGFGKVADIVTSVQKPIGAVVGAVPTLGYGWIFCGGFALAADEWVKGDGDCAAGEAIYAVADTFDTAAAVDDNVLCGTCMVADTPYITGYFNFFGG